MMEGLKFIKNTSISSMVLTVLYNLKGSGFTKTDLKETTFCRTYKNSQFPNNITQFLSIAAMPAINQNSQLLKINNINTTKRLLSVCFGRCFPEVNSLRLNKYSTQEAHIETRVDTSVNCKYNPNVILYYET